MKEKIETYITYKWEEQSLKFVDEIEGRLNSIPPIRVVRDKNFIHYGDSIEKFMDELRQGDIVVMVVSDQYLRSLNCMYEMSGLFEDETCVEKVLPVMVSTSIRDSKYYLELCSHWKDELSKLDEIIHAPNYDDKIIEPIRKDLHKVENIIKCLPRLFEYCREINAPDVETMRKDGYAGLVSRITERANQLQIDSLAVTQNLARLIIEINKLSVQQFAKVVSSYKADYSEVKISGFDGQPQSSNPTFVIDDTPMAIYAILHDLQKEVGEDQIANIRYSSSKRHREYTLRNISDTLKKMKHE
jgi:hypothetical protein